MSAPRTQVGRRAGRPNLRLAPHVAVLLDAMDGLISPRSRRIVATYGLFITFLIVSTRKAFDFAVQGYVGIDLRIYRAAAHAVLIGENPWPATGHDAPFAATPPTIVAYLPAALMPDMLAGIVYALLSVAAAMFVIRRLRLPIWWILFPPLFESILVLNPDVFVIALLVAGPRIAALAVPLKVYAVIPLLLERRWWAASAGLFLAALAGPAWIVFLGQFGSVFGKLSEQSMGGLSASGTWLMVPTALALFSLRGRGASWLAVPGLWPYTQLHYSCIALPIVATSPLLAFLFSFGIPALPPIAIVIFATQTVLVDVARPYRRLVAEAPRPSVMVHGGQPSRPAWAYRARP